MPLLRQCLNHLKHNGILIVDSNISDTPSEEYKVDKNLSLFGRTWKEHETDTPTEDRMSALWSSLHNDSAFWLTERSLTNALLHAGFGHINKSLFPFHEWEHKCRDIWFAHHSRRKSQKIHFRVEPDERPVMASRIFMKIIFIHKGFPGQFKHLVGALLKLGHEIISISPSKVAKYSGVKHITYQAEKGNSLDAHTLIHETETKVIRGAAVAKEAYNLKESGYIPNLIIGHPGWGECLFLHTIWKNVPQIHYIEYAYDSEDSDTQYQELKQDFADWKSQAKLHMKMLTFYLIYKK